MDAILMRYLSLISSFVLEFIFRSPTMAGGLFAINSQFFRNLGLYDPGFDIWGGENLELSFKTWMCGGTLETIPCSHVGHVYRKKSPYAAEITSSVLRRNLVRLAEVWMDDYKKHYYRQINYKLVSTHFHESTNNTAIQFRIPKMISITFEYTTS